MDSKDIFPEFDSMPNWAKWVAQDADGALWAYEVEPLQSHIGWYENEVGRRVKLAHAEPTEHWRTKLKRC